MQTTSSKRFLCKWSVWVNGGWRTYSETVLAADAEEAWEKFAYNPNTAYLSVQELSRD